MADGLLIDMHRNNRQLPDPIPDLINYTDYGPNPNSNPNPPVINIDEFVHEILVGAAEVVVDAVEDTLKQAHVPYP